MIRIISEMTANLRSGGRSGRGTQREMKEEEGRGG
jgi:hypothetical protein